MKNGGKKVSISVETIRKYMYSAKVYDEACAYVDSGQVEIIRTRSFWKSEASIEGKVCGVTCKLSVSNDDVASFACTCHDFKSKRGMCSHIGALAFAHIKKNELGQQGVVYTSGEAKRIVSVYLKRAEKGNYAEDRAMDVELACRIELQFDSLAVEFFVSKGKKKYQIKDLYEFDDMWVESRYHEYGTGFKIVHDMTSFKESEIPMLKFLLKYIRASKSLAAVYANQQNDTYVKDRKKLVLIGSAIDEFFSICHDSIKNITLRCRNSFSTNEKNIRIIEDSPDINISLEAIANQGYMAEISGVEKVTEGEKNIYILWDNVIYKADEEFSNGVREFLVEACKADYDNSSKTYKLIFNKKDMPAFCNLVISDIKQYITVTQKNVDIEEFEPWELSCEFHVDVAAGELRCHVKCFYNEERFDLFKGIGAGLGICRDYNKESRIKNVLLKYFPEGETYGTLSTYDYRHVYEFLKNGIKELERFGEVTLSEKVRNYEVIDSMKINAEVSMEGNWLKLDVDAGEYTRAELDELLAAYRRKEKYIKLGENKLVRLDDNGLELLAQMAFDLDFSAMDIINHHVFIPKYRALYIDGRLREGDLVAYDKDAAFKALVRTIKQVEDSEFMVPEELEETLRGYQKHGFHWLRTLDACGFGGILADDMGLGKTLQIITLLLDEKISVSRNTPSLIIAPASLIYNWENEIRHFAPQLKAVAVAGTKNQRREVLSNFNEYDVLITSYDLLKRDIDMYDNLSFRFQVIDEAQNIKNFSTANAKSVKKIQAQTRYALTGTPIENRLSELWSIFDYLMPGFLYSYNKFREKFENPIMKNGEIGATKGLTRLIGPFVLRRLKKDVLKELPEKQEYDIFAKLEGKQRKLYTANALKLKDKIEKTDDDGFGDKRIEILSELMKLRQLCCDPSLCYNDYDGESAKLDMCMDMISNGISGGHKILLFSQFTTMLDIIGKRLKEENIEYYLLTGATSKESRAKLVDTFNNDNTGVFLISLKAGGVGLNLTGADMVIHYDPWWNVAAENQASDRAHRIGQDKVVSVFKLITKGTIEERIQELQRRKAQLADNILNGDTISLSSLSKNELLSILNV